MGCVLRVKCEPAFPTFTVHAQSALTPSPHHPEKSILVISVLLRVFVCVAAEIIRDQSASKRHVSSIFAVP